jgi:tRNA U34 2-thiouridine synthase MnmA/TrmU
VNENLVSKVCFHKFNLCHRYVTEVDFVREYWHAVFEPFLRDFDGGGSTPNPDLACNRHIKFGALLHHCTATLGADLLATAGLYKLP